MVVTLSHRVLSRGVRWPQSD